MAETAGAHLRFRDPEQFDDGAAAEAVARVDQLALVLDLPSLGGLLGSRDDRAHPRRGLAFVPGTAGEPLGQGPDFPPDHRGGHQVAHRRPGEQQPEITLTGRKGAEPSLIEQLLQLGQTQLPQASGIEGAQGTGRSPPPGPALPPFEPQGSQLVACQRQDLVGEKVEVPDFASRRDRLDQRTRPAVAGAKQTQHAGSIGGETIGAKVTERVVDDLLAGAPAGQGDPWNWRVQPDQGKTATRGQREARGWQSGAFQRLEREVERMLRMHRLGLGPVVVEIGKEGVQLRQMNHSTARAEEAVLGQVDVGLAAKLADGVGEIGDRDRCLMPAAAIGATGDGDPAETGGMQGENVLGRGAQPERASRLCRSDGLPPS